MKRLAFFLVICAIICIITFPVNAALPTPSTWTLAGSSHTGTVTLNPDGTGTATIDTYPMISFTYTINRDGNIEGYYWLWSLDGQYDPVQNLITFPSYPGMELLPKN
jgi:hypothetical protein